VSDRDIPADARAEIRTPTGIGAAVGLMLVLINVLWAGSAIAAKAALGSSSAPSRAVGPWALGFARFAPAAAVFLIYLRLTGGWKPISKEHRRDFLLLGIFGLALTYGIFYGGLRRTSATESTLLVSAEPVFIALMARVMLRERLTADQWLGLGIGFIGVYVLVNRGLVLHTSSNVVGNACIALALCFEAYSGVISKRLARHYPGVMILAVEMLVGSGAMFPLAVWEIHAGPWSWPSIPGVLGIAYLAIVCTIFCYGAWFHLLPRLRLSSMAGFLYIQPVMGPVYGRLFLRERLEVWTCVGGIIVAAGVWLLARGEAAA